LHERHALLFRIALLQLPHVRAVFGSGWCWLELCVDRLLVSWKPNQVSSLQHKCRPLLGIDMWGVFLLCRLVSR
jgi:hypothetical protein